MLKRRPFLALSAAALFIAGAGLPLRAFAAGPDAFVRQFADELVAIVNGPGAAAQKRNALVPVIDRYVDVPAVARFALGRFWNVATPAQQQEYVTLFHRVLMNNISGHLGDYRGVTYSLTGDSPQGNNTLVGTTINRPGQPSINVQWVVDSTPKVIDVIAEGTSMRITQRSDYASYLGEHGGSIEALLQAMHHQLDNNAS